MKKYSFFIGRYQPLHEGHVKLIRTILNEGKNVCIALRKTKIDKKNPYDVNTRIEMFKNVFYDEMETGKLIVIAIPDIEEIVWGRKVGWGRRQIKLDAKTESISATEIRKKK